MARSTHLSTTAAIGLGIGVGLAALLGGGYLAGHALAGDKLPRNASISGVAVGGLSAEEAEQKLRAELAQRAGQKLTLTAGDADLAVAPAEAGLAVDYAASVVAAGGGSSWNPITILTILFGGGATDAVVSVDQAKLATVVDSLAKQVDTPAVNASIDYEKLKPVIDAKSAPGTVVDATAAADATTAAYLRSTSVSIPVVTDQPAVTTAAAEAALSGIAATAVSAPVKVRVAGKGTIELTAAMIAASLEFRARDGALAPVFDTSVLAKQIDPALKKLGLHQPQDARFTIADGKPKLVAATDGIGIDTAGLATALAGVVGSSGGRSVEAALTKRAPDLTTAEAKKLGVSSVTGSFTTYFPGTAYRYNNIGKAAKLINGTFVKPGQTFSMNATLGKRTKAAGWMAGGAIDGGKIVERLGGGISQATTTTFNAIFFAGLQDVYHKPHSLYFNRYPVGREATLDWVSVDMKFKNDSPYGVLLQAGITGKAGSQGSVTVRVWSTKRYTIKTTTPVKSNYRAPGATVYDDSTGCKAQNAMTGFDVRFDRLFYQGKKLVKREPFSWSYNSLTPVVCGTKPVP